MTDDQNRKRKNEIFEAPNAQDQVRAAPPEVTGLKFEVPVVEVPLPSNGIVYPADHPLHGKTSVMIESMTTRQENILTNRALAKQGTMLSSLITSVLREKGVDPRAMLTGDRNTLMVALRVSGYGPEYTVQMVCPVCSHAFKQEFDLSQLPVKRLEIQPVREGVNEFSFVLPLSKATVVFKFLTGADEEEIAQTQVRKKKQGLESADLVTQGLMYSIVSIHGETDRSKIARVINSLRAFDSRALRKHIADNEPGMQLKGWMECPNCDHTREVDMPMEANFFWPDA